MTLQVRGLSKSYAGVQALSDVSFDVAPGECVALIGPNGAGKSTCFACIAGQLLASGGTVAWQGKPLGAMSPAQRVALGVGRTFQVAQVFDSLTVEQNLSLQNSEQGNEQTLRQPGNIAQNLGLEALLNTRAADLPYGAKKRLELGMALATNPGLLLLDEPAAGLSQTERASLMQQIKSIAASGVAVLYTEHNMDAVFGVADRVLVLIDGKLVAQGSAAEVQADTVVRQRYLGAATQNQPATKARLTGPVQLQISQLNAWWGEAQALFDVSLNLRQGQCTVLRGLNGAGKSSLLQAIAGIGPRAQGSINLSGHAIQNLPAHQRANAGLGWVAEDRRIFTALTVHQNLLVAATGSKLELAARQTQVLALFPALANMLKRPAAQMSGGEQQMLAIARCLMGNPQTLLLDEPCEGIAPVLVQHIVTALTMLKTQGVTMLIAEQHAALEPLADEVVGLVAGRVGAERPSHDSPADVTAAD